MAYRNMLVVIQMALFVPSTMADWVTTESGDIETKSYLPFGPSDRFHMECTVTMTPGSMELKDSSGCVMKSYPAPNPSPPPLPPPPAIVPVVFDNKNTKMIVAPGKVGKPENSGDGWTNGQAWTSDKMIDAPGVSKYSGFQWRVSASASAGCYVMVGLTIQDIATNSNYPLVRFGFYTLRTKGETARWISRGGHGDQIDSAAERAVFKNKDFHTKDDVFKIQVAEDGKLQWFVNDVMNREEVPDHKPPYRIFVSMHDDATHYKAVDPEWGVTDIQLIP